jgi:uncharacterized lipoprotein YddW (UPF0748 family)
MRKKLFTYSALAAVCFLYCLAAIAQQVPKRELRAAWIATVANIDWPSKKGLNAQEQQVEYVKLLDHLKSVGMNAVIVQVRPVADALYPSSYEPWSEYLSGTQGQSSLPYYNPLSFMIEQARQRGLEFHAWFNPYRASMKEDFVHAANHPIQQHPEWFVQYGGKWYYDPGHPEGREFVLQSIMETIKHYDLDAVHFDDYFYPYRVANQEFPDSISYAAFGQEAFSQKDDWRRNNVDYFVEELSRRIKQEKPHVKFGISPFGVWRNQDQDPEGSATRAGVTNYDDLYADVLKWLREGWIDYVTPQIYWHIGFERAEYKTLVEWWSRHSYGRHLYIGQAAYRMGEKGWEDPFEIMNQISFNRGFPQVHGSMYFSAKSFLMDKDSVSHKVGSLYAHKALVPVMDWIKAEAPVAPEFLEISGSQGAGVKLEWKDVSPGNSAYYVIYRFKEDEELDIENSAHILDIVQRKPYATQAWVDLKTDKRSEYTYLVTAVDRLNNESKPGKAFTIKTKGKRGDIRLR